MKKISCLPLTLLMLFLFSCGDGDDDGGLGGGIKPNPRDPHGIVGVWYCIRLEADVEADTEETYNKVMERLASEERRQYTGLSLIYLPDTGDYLYTYRDIPGSYEESNGWFENNEFISYASPWLRYELKDGLLFREYDYTETYQQMYSGVAKAVQRTWLRKMGT